MRLSDNINRPWLIMTGCRIALLEHIQLVIVWFHDPQHDIGMCKTCADRNSHVQLAGLCLKGLGQETVKKYLDECSYVKPIHVLKNPENSYALLHFANKQDAADFYFLYKNNERALCKRLPDILVNPSLINNVPVVYKKTGAQSRINPFASKCRCPNHNHNAVNPNHDHGAINPNHNHGAINPNHDHNTVNPNHDHGAVNPNHYHGAINHDHNAVNANLIY